MKRPMPERGDYAPHINLPPSSANSSAKPADKPLFAVGDTVMHPSEGICNVLELRSMHFAPRGSKLYYVLKPSMEKSSSTVYMPVDRGNGVLRRLLKEADIDGIIASSAEYPNLWVTDSKQRKDAFALILTEGNYAKIIRMIQEIHEHSALRTQEGKKPCASDEAIMNDAERLLHQEFAYVLGLSQEDTATYIKDRIKSAS